MNGQIAIVPNANSAMAASTGQPPGAIGGIASSTASTPVSLRFCNASMPSASAPEISPSAMNIAPTPRHAPICGIVRFMIMNSNTCSDMPTEIARAGLPVRAAATFTAVFSMP